MAPVSKGGALKTEGSWHLIAKRYREDEMHRKRIEDVLFDPQCFPQDIFREEENRSIWDEFLADPTTKNHSFEIDMLLSFGLLHRLIPTDGLA